MRVGYNLGMNDQRQKIGRMGEGMAADYLIARGLLILDKNVRTPYGEIDLVASDPDARTLVFVEVKTRTSESFGRIDESIDRRKLERLSLAISRYVAEHRYRGPYRLDAVFVKIGKDNVISHIRDIAAD